MGGERYVEMGWREQYQGGSSYIRHNPTNQISELGLSFLYINIGRTGRGGTWLCCFQLDPSDSINWASLPGSCPPDRPCFHALKLFWPSSGLCKEGWRQGRERHFPQTACRWHQSSAGAEHGSPAILNTQQGRGGEDLSAEQGLGRPGWGMCPHHLKMAEGSSG